MDTLLNPSAEAPIIIAEGLDLSFYQSISDAELELEPIDVTNGIYDGFDALGRRLSMTVDGSSVRITLAELQPRHSDKLRDILRRFLDHVSARVSEEQGASLHGLVDACRPYVKGQSSIRP